MGLKNEATKKYVRRPDIFADIANYYLFGGEQRIRQEDLVEKDVTELVMAYNDLPEIVSKEKLRDILKGCTLKSAGSYDILVIGIENQADIHYAMPVKNLIYDAINYTTQADVIARRHKEEKDLKGDEFLSHFSREDRLIPVVTITVYYGTREWDAPRSLHDMFSLQDEGILKFVDNYHLNLIIPGEIKNFEDFHTQFGKVMEFIAASGSRERMDKIMQDRKYSRMEKDAVSVMEACTNIKIPSRYEKEGKIDMCKAWQEQYNDGQESGMEKGMEKGIEEGRIKVFMNMVIDGIPKERAISIAEISEEQADSAMKKINMILEFKK